MKPLYSEFEIKRKRFYGYNENERIDAINKLGKNPEITRFKGLGEISPDEFGGFIGEDIRLEPVLLSEDTSISKILQYYMGKNTQDRQEFIINNLRIEIDEASDNQDKEIDQEETTIVNELQPKQAI